MSMANCTILLLIGILQDADLKNLNCQAKGRYFGIVKSDNNEGLQGKNLGRHSIGMLSRTLKASMRHQVWTVHLATFGLNQDRDESSISQDNLGRFTMCGGAGLSSPAGSGQYSAV